MILHVLPLLTFTTLAGFAAGAYATDAVCGNGQEANKPWIFPLVCLVLLGVGLCGTLTHLGQPLRFMNGMANPQSGISQESYWAIALGVIIVVDLLIAWRKGKTVRIVRWIGGAIAVGLMVVTGLAYFDCLGLIAWRGSATLPVFILGDVALGASLCAVFSKTDNWALGLLGPANIAAQIAWGTTIVTYGAYLARIGIGLDAMVPLSIAFIVGTICVSAVTAATRCGKLSGRTAAISVLVLTSASVLIVRYVFFAMGVGA